MATNALTLFIVSHARNGYPGWGRKNATSPPKRDTGFPSR